MKLRHAFVAGTALVAASTSSTSTTAASPDRGIHQIAPVMWHTAQAEAGRSGMVGEAWATLVRSDRDLSFEVATNSLTPGNGYTMWLVIIDNPAACSTLPCPSPEVLNDERTDSQVSYAAGHVAGASGKAIFAGSVQTGPLDGWLRDRSFDNVTGASVELILHDHGPALPQATIDMLTTFRGGCTDTSLPPVPPDALDDGEPGPNECRFFQRVVFQDPLAPGAP